MLLTLVFCTRAVLPALLVSEMTLPPAEPGVGLYCGVVAGAKLSAGKALRP